jgi:hypothetical protein
MQDQRSNPRRKVTDAELEIANATRSQSNRETFEFVLFFVFGSAVWIFVSYRLLRYLRFPFHAHPYETVCIFSLPVLLVALILKIIERGTRPKQD